MNVCNLSCRGFRTPGLLKTSSMEAFHDFFFICIFLSPRGSLLGTSFASNVELLLQFSLPFTWRWRAGTPETTDVWSGIF